METEPDRTLGGYLKVHQRPPAFEGSDGSPYTVDVFVDQDPDEVSPFRGALLFVRWSRLGDTPESHLETDYLVSGKSRREVVKQLRDLSLYRVKELLEMLIAAQRETQAGN